MRQRKKKKDGPVRVSYLSGNNAHAWLNFSNQHIRVLATTFLNLRPADLTADTNYRAVRIARGS